MWRRAIVWLIALSLSFIGLARTGAWVDEVIFFSEPSADKAIEMLKTGEADLYAYSLTRADLLQKVIEDPNLSYANSYAVYTELTFNPYPADPAVMPKEFKNGMLNPFAVPAIREAMNWLIDREYIVEEIYKGTAVPRYLPLTPSFPDYARLIDKCRELEAKYAHNPQKAKEVIFAEMEKLGAELVDGKWYYKGKPVTIIFLIRTEDERKEIGDYVAGLLEELGFTVDRRYGVSRDLAKCWIFTDPAEGCFHIYTGGWVTTVVSRDQGGNFDFFYTNRGLGAPLWQAYYVKPEADEVFKKLAYNDFTTVEERLELMRKALDYAMENSVRVWLANETPFFAFHKDLSVAVDLAGGVYGSWLWAYSIHWKDPETGQPKPGGTVRIAIGEMFNEPWNPVAGTNWIYDLMPIRGTGNPFVLPDPFTGLYHPQRVEKAEVYVKEGLPVSKTLDWVELNFVDEIKVPEDAWVDWDAANQRFITVAEKFPEGLTAKVKVVIHYDPNLFEDTWHDGSKYSVADILLPFILTFDRGKEDSPIFDESAKPSLEAFLEYFKGLRLISTNPLVIEVYTDTWYLDAEWIVADNVIDAFYAQGPGAWHTVALGIKAEAAGEAAFSSDKADKKGVEWLSYIAGPTLDVLRRYLDEALAEGYVPYANVLGQYVSKEEAVARYENLKKWVEEKGHFWVGDGPFYVDSVDTLARTITLKRFEAFRDPADKWLRFAEPKIAQIDFLGAPEVLEIGTGAVIPVNITFKGEPYPPEEIEFVKYLLFDAEGNLVTVGTAEYAGGPTWNVVLPPELTEKLPEGTVKLEVAVCSKVVAIPSFASVEFIAVP